MQIEREKADLSVQVIQLSERLEEAEGGAESQVNTSKTLFLIVNVKTKSSLAVRKYMEVEALSNIPTYSRINKN